MESIAGSSLGLKIQKLFNLPDTSTNITICAKAGEPPTIHCEFYVEGAKAEQLTAVLSQYKID